MKILRGYHSLVAVKTHRAMRSRYKGFTEDTVNSAEVARKSARKCIKALATLGERCPGDCGRMRHPEAYRREDQS